jgi:hypothetical protein
MVLFRQELPEPGNLPEDFETENSDTERSDSSQEPETLVPSLRHNLDKLLIHPEPVLHNYHKTFCTLQM